MFSRALPQETRVQGHPDTSSPSPASPKLTPLKVWKRPQLTAQETNWPEALVIVWGKENRDQGALVLGHLDLSMQEIKPSEAQGAKEPQRRNKAVKELPTPHHRWPLQKFA